MPVPGMRDRVDTARTDSSVQSWLLPDNGGAQRAPRPGPGQVVIRCHADQLQGLDRPNGVVLDGFWDARVRKVGLDDTSAGEPVHRSPASVAEEPNTCTDA